MRGIMWLANRGTYTHVLGMFICGDDRASGMTSRERLLTILGRSAIRMGLGFLASYLTSVTFLHLKFPELSTAIIVILQWTAIVGFYKRCWLGFINVYFTF